MQTQQQPKDSTSTIIAIAQEATRGWLEIVTKCRELEKKHSDGENIDITDYMEQMRFQMTRNYSALMKKIEESKTESKEHVAKNWIRDNLEEAQQFIDNIVGIKGITEDPLKVAAELEGVGQAEEMPYGWNVIAANTAGTLQREFLADAEKKDISHVYVSPPQEELFGY